MPMRTTRAARLAALILILLVAAAAVVVGWSEEAHDHAADVVRPSALAGNWYSADPEILAKTIDGLLAAAHPEAPAVRLRALVAPHAGYAYSGATAAAAFKLVQGADYGRVVLLAPSHRADFDGLSIAPVDAYATPLGQVPLDEPVIAKLRASPLVHADSDAHAQEHAIEIELPFLQRTLAPGWRLVPILVGRLDGNDYARAADLIRPFVDDHTLLVVSSDFTHYGPRFGYLPFLPDEHVQAQIRALDDGAVARIAALDAQGLLEYRARTGITVCGIRPLAVLLALLPADAEVHRLAYATSGELTGDWLNSVSYVALGVTAPAGHWQGGVGAPSPARSRAQDRGGDAAPTGEGTAPDAGLDADNLARLHRLAVLGIRRAVLGSDQVPDAELLAAVDGLPPALEQRAGAFVTLWKDGALRGCVGHVPDDLPVFLSVLQSGANAATRDNRFRAVQPEELDKLEVEVNVLTPPRPIDSIDELHLGEQGVTLEKDGHYALYLPEVASKMGWDRETTMSQLALKAGLPADAWRDGASFEVFTTVEYKAHYAWPAAQDGPAPH
jgi:hypothetical protein